MKYPSFGGMKYSSCDGMKKTLSLGLIYAVLMLGLLVIQPIGAHAQSTGGTPNPYIDALATQAALNAQATQTAYQQQQNAAAAAVAAAQAQTQAYAAAQQATITASQQQAVLSAAQATSDAAALQATAIVQQTRTALEISAQQTRTAGDVRATATAIALQVKATQAVIDQTRTADEAKRRDDVAIATSVAISLDATKQAIDVQTRTDAERAGNDRRAQSIGSTVLIALFVITGLLAALIIGKFFRNLWRSRALNPPTAPQPITPITPATSTAAEAVVDAQTGMVSSRLAAIEHNDNPADLDRLLRYLYGDQHEQ
jgi:hypothetical protein